MRNFGVCCMALLLGIVSGIGYEITVVHAQDVSQADKDRALAYLESTKKGVLDSTKGLSEDQWNFKPGPDRWSVAEVMEHIAAAEDLVRGGAQQVMNTPARPVRNTAEVKGIDDALLRNAPDRTKKRQAPEPLKPTNRFGSPDAALKHFVESRAVTEEFLTSTSGLRTHYGWIPPGSAPDGPPFGRMDAYEWILFVAAHSERHTKQILEVETDPNFPKK